MRPLRAARVRQDQHRVWDRPRQRPALFFWRGAGRRRGCFGHAGQLLTKIIEACTLSRDEVYILNVLKCRPPDNRQPLPQEVANCRVYFERQLEVIAPEFICCLGTTAAQSLLQTDEPIGKLRGRWVKHGSAQVICTYHPSYLLRNPNAKRHVWDDMKILMARMGVDL